MFKKIFSTILFSLFGVFIINAQPTWNVNPGSYNNSMIVTGVINLNYIESTNSNDIVGAFVGAECRGVASPVYVPAVDRYIVYLMIYSNASTDTITFKVYQQSSGTIFDIEKTLTFSNNGVVGTTATPYVWSNPTLSSEAFILTYSAVNEISPAVFDGNNITIFMPFGTDFTSIVSNYTTSAGARVTVNGTVQTSGTTANNFTNPVDYLVRSADETASNTYTVTAEIMNSAPSDILLSCDSIIEIARPGTTVGGFSAVDLEPGIFSYSLVSGVGSTDNNKFTIIDDTLKTNTLFYYNIQNLYSIRVKVTDEDGGILEKQFNIRIIDFYEDLFISDTILLETIQIDSLVAILSNTDTINFANNYSLVAGEGSEDNNNFSIENNTLITAELFDYESKTEHNIRLQITDNVGWTFQKQFIIYVIDENDENPIAANGDVSIDENIFNEIIYTVVATDADVSPEFREIKYFFNDTTIVDFSIDSLTGEITVLNPLDYEIQSEYPLLVGITDSVNFSECTITVFLNDLNDEVTQAPDTVVIEVSDLTDIGTEIYQFYATDSDANSTLTFTIDNDFDRTFDLTTNGLLTLQEYLDFDSKSLYQFVVSVSDGLNEKDINVILNVVYTDKTDLKANKIISPNYDNYLDFWEIENEIIYRDCIFQIFTASGTLVFEQLGYFNKWDGTYNGKELPIGAYYYLVKTPRGEYVKGSITLIK